MTPIVALRDVDEEDLPIFFDHQMDPEAIRMAAFSPRPHPEFLAHWHRILEDDRSIEQTILADGEVVGYIVRFEQSGLRQIGYWIGREVWGRGIATQALALFLHRYRERPVHAYVAAANLGSRRVLEKCGFKVIGESKGYANARGEEIEELLLELQANDGTESQ